MFDCVTMWATFACQIYNGHNRSKRSDLPEYTLPTHCPKSQKNRIDPGFAFSYWSNVDMLWVHQVSKINPPTTTAIKQNLTNVFWTMMHICMEHGNGIIFNMWFIFHNCHLIISCRIWSWSPMPCEKHGPRDSVDKNRGRRPRFLSLLRPEGHVFHTAWETMIKFYYSTLTDLFFLRFIRMNMNFSALNWGDFWLTSWLLWKLHCCYMDWLPKDIN